MKVLMPSTRAARRPRGIASALALVLAFLASSAAADAPALETVELPGSPDVSPLPPPTVTARGLANRWNAFLAADDGSESERAAFEAVRLGALELGITDLEDHARTLLIRAAEAPGPRAATLIEWAGALAPHSLEVAQSRLDQQWSDAPWAVLPLLRQGLSVRGAALELPEERLRLEAGRWRLLLWLAVGLALCFTATQVVRYFDLGAYDLASRLGHIVGLGWTRALLLLSVALPASLLGSPLVGILLFIVLLWPYQQRAERVLTGIAVGCLVAVPFLVTQLAQVESSSPAQASFFHRAQSDLCDLPCLDRLRSVERGSPDNEVARFTAAMLASRRGTTADLTRAWNLLREPFSPVLEDAAQLLRGNVLATSGRAHQALGYYRPLSEDADVHPRIRTAATFNAYRSLQDQGAESSADGFLTTAQDLDREAVIAFIEDAARQANRWYMSPPLSADLLVTATGELGSHPVELSARELASPLLGRLSATTYLALIAVALGAIALMTVWRKRLQPSESCPQCGMVMSAREAPAQTAAGYCPDCYTLYMEGAALDLETRRALEARVTKHDRARRVATIAANVLGAGLGFVIRGSIALGAPLLVLAVVGVAILVNSTEAARPLSFATASFDGARTLAVVALALAFLGSWTLTWLRRSTL